MQKYTNCILGAFCCKNIFQKIKSYRVERLNEIIAFAHLNLVHEFPNQCR